MKDSKKDIEKEVDTTLKALEGLNKAKTDDFFYSRLERRLEQEQVHTSSSNWGVSFAAAAVLIFVVLNIVVLREYSQNQAVEQITEQEYLEAFAQEYETPMISYYQIYNDEE